MALELKKVLISDSVDPSCREILESGGLTVDYRPGISKEELLAIIPQYDGLVVRSGTKVTAEVIAAGTQLKLIGRAGTGVDNIDLVAATEHGVLVMNTPGGNTISAAEHTCALLSTIARNIPQGHCSMKAGKWDRKKYMGVELYGKTLGIVGLGRIGREVATRMQSYGMKTVGYDPLVPADMAAEFGVEFMELKDMWPIVDFITVHTPLIPATKGLLNDAVFGKCKRGVRVVNVARGGIIDEEALLRALENGQCGGAGLDVFTEEPPTNRALIDHERLVATPHLGASTTEAQLKVAQEVAQQFVDAARGVGLNGLVNAPFLGAMTVSSRPWVDLAACLGTLAAALLKKQPTAVTVTCAGDAVKSLGDIILPSVLAASLQVDRVNRLNATSKAKKMGVATLCQTDPSSSRCSVTVKLTAGDQSVSLQGIVLGTAPFLVAIGDQETASFELRGNILVYEGANLLEVMQQEGCILVQRCGNLVLVKMTTLPAAHTAAAAVTL